MCTLRLFEKTSRSDGIMMAMMRYYLFHFLLAADDSSMHFLDDFAFFKSSLCVFRMSGFFLEIVLYQESRFYSVERADTIFQRLVTVCIFSTF